MLLSCYLDSVWQEVTGSPLHQRCANVIWAYATWIKLGAATLAMMPAQCVVYYTTARAIRKSQRLRISGVELNTQRAYSLQIAECNVGLYSSVNGVRGMRSAVSFVHLR